jgi:DNA-binding transcriptional ArsR family regulator
MEDLAAAELAKALSHPLRVGYLRALGGQHELSPSEFAREFGEPLANVSYHVKALHEAGLLAVTATVPRGGAMEHRYSLSGPRAGVATAVLDLLAAG